MSKFAEMLIVSIFVLVFFIFLAVIYTAAGASVGWIVGLFFDETILSTLARFGVKTEGLAMWQLGATLGFVGAFFKSPTGKSSN